jgi:hypothetical protein
LLSLIVRFPSSNLALCIANVHLQSSLFGSWFSYGLPAIMWLVMNKGRWFESWKQIVLTVINLVILGIACAIVCLNFPCVMEICANNMCSADWVCMCPASRSTTARPRPPGPVPTMPPKLAKITTEKYSSSLTTEI